MPPVLDTVGRDKNMREHLLDALMYVFENYLENNAEINSSGDKITTEMLKVGFSQREVNKALGWFGDLHNIKTSAKTNLKISQNSIRIYTDNESNKITAAGRGYLLYLEEANIVDAISRELIIDRAMALEEPCVDVPEIKWVALLVLFSQQEKRDQLQSMEELVLFLSHM